MSPSRFALLAAVLRATTGSLLLGAIAAQAPIVYTIRAPEPASHHAVVEARVPTGGSDAVLLFMPVWSPGFYRVENYARNVEDFAALAPDGKTLTVDKPQDNRWRVTTGGASEVVVTYTLRCQGRSVTTDQVGEDFAVFNGPATFVTLVETQARPHEVRLELPPSWRDAATALPAAKDGLPHHYVAADFDTLADSPIVAGALAVHEFTAGGALHRLVDFGAVGAWDGDKAAALLRPVADEHGRFLGKLPFDHYVFLNAFRPGGGGLEHACSTLLTSNPGTTRAPGVRWLSFVSHEYFHAINVKRLRPVELGPFDYEHPPTTPSLWIAEGLTTYYGDLALVRSGVATPDEWLGMTSAQIRSLQQLPGRKVQTLEQASLQVWDQSTSGVGGDPRQTVDYYVKGPVVGFVVDAAIRRATDGRQSLDDVMRLAYSRWSGARGYTHDQFLGAVSEVAGTDLAPLLQSALRSTDELDYQPALAWLGLRFAGGEPPSWKLEPRADATDAQRRHFAAWLAASPQR